MTPEPESPSQAAGLQAATAGDGPVVTAPDGSAVEPLLRGARASMATFTLAAGAVSGAVAHRSIEELWYVVAGAGEIWRSLNGEEAVTPLSAGTAVDLPPGTHFQFRAGPDALLVIVGATIPPWPGDDEAYPVPAHW